MKVKIGKNVCYTRVEIQKKKTLRPQRLPALPSPPSGHRGACKGLEEAGTPVALAVLLNFCLRVSVTGFRV